MKATGGLMKLRKTHVWRVGYNMRRWVFGYERDVRWASHTLYLGPFYISRRLRIPKAVR